MYVLPGHDIVIKFFETPLADVDVQAHGALDAANRDFIFL